MNIPKEELKKDEERSIVFVDDANSLKITSQVKLTEATGFLKDVKVWQKMLKAKRMDITRPINEGLNLVRDLFRPIETKIEYARRLAEVKIRDYDDLLRKEAEEKKAEIEEKVESGEMKPEVAGNKLDKMESKQGVIKKRIQRDIEIVDKTQIPLEYLIPDMVAIRKDALAGKVIAGVKVIEKTIIL